MVDDVRRSILIKAEEVGELREQTLTDNRGRLLVAAATARGLASTRAASCSPSATAARRPTRWTWWPTSAPAPQGWPAAPRDRPDRGRVDPDRDRQRHRRRGDLPAPGDRLRARRATRSLALSTSGNSVNLIEALAEAAQARPRDGRLRRLRRRPDRRGRRSPTTWSSRRSQHIPRIQEAQASAYHVLRELVELAIRATAARSRRRRARPRRAGPGARDGAGRRLPAVRLPARRPSSSSGGWVLNDERGVAARGRGRPERRRRVPRPPAGRGAAAGGRSSGVATEAAPSRPASAGSGSSSLERGGDAGRAGLAGHRDLRTTASPSCSTPPTAATATRSSTAPTAARASRSCAASPTTAR